MPNSRMKPFICDIAAHVINTTESSGAKLKNTGWAHTVACCASIRELTFDRYVLTLWKRGLLNRDSRWKK